MIGFRGLGVSRPMSGCWIFRFGGKGSPSPLRNHSAKPCNVVSCYALPVPPRFVSVCCMLSREMLTIVVSRLLCMFTPT